MSYITHEQSDICLFFSHSLTLAQAQSLTPTLQQTQGTPPKSVYLPIAHSPDGSPLTEEDYVYKEKLKKWVFKQGGTYYRKEDEWLKEPLLVVPLCQATKDCRPKLLVCG